MKKYIFAAMAASLLGLAAQAQITNIPSDKLKTSRTLPPAVRKAPDLKIETPPPAQTSAPTNGKTYGSFYCRGQANKWRIQKVPNGPNAGKYILMAWYTLGDYNISRGCYWNGRTPTQTDGRDASPTNEITLEYMADLSGDLYNMVYFQGETPTSLEINEDMMWRDRSFHKLWLLSAKGADQGVYVLRTTRGNNGGFGRIYKVYHVDIEGGYRFPADVTSAPLQ